LREKYDLYFSTPVGCFFLHDTYGWPLEKCYAQAHSEFDIEDALRRFPQTYFDRLAGYAAISPAIREASIARNVPRLPTLLPVGITAANYARPMSTSLRRLGYFGRMARSDHDQPDLKRGYLAERVARESGLEFYQREHLHFLAADRLYREVDVVMFCSTTEGNPYVALEAAAAGVPTLGTPVGLFPDIANNGAGFLLPVDPEQFVAGAVEVIRQLRDQPALYQYVSQTAVSASQPFDWSAVAPRWKQEFARVCCKDAMTRKDSHVSEIKEAACGTAAAYHSD
jgi:hypothetical protein